MMKTGLMRKKRNIGNCKYAAESTIRSIKSEYTDSDKISAQERITNPTKIQANRLVRKNQRKEGTIKFLKLWASDFLKKYKLPVISKRKIKGMADKMA
jgi:hypothetical protein